MKKYLLITSDDFGISHSVNSGILKAFQSGLLQSSNFMTTAPWFPEAIKIAKAYNLPIGVHLTLTCEWTNLKHGPITKGKTLTDSLGYFLPTYKELFEQMDLDEVKNEYRAQINRVIASGITPTHVETHMLSPLMGTGYPNGYNLIHKAVLEVAAEFNLIYTYDTVNSKLKYFDTTFESTLSDYSTVTKKLSVCKAGIHHMVCHCGFDNQELNGLSDPDEAVYKWGGRSRQQDLDLILSPRFKDFIKNEGFELINIEKLLQLTYN